MICKGIMICKGNRYLANSLFIVRLIVRFSLRLLMISTTFSSSLNRLKVRSKFLKNYYTIHNPWQTNNIKWSFQYSIKIFWTPIMTKANLIHLCSTVQSWIGVPIAKKPWKRWKCGDLKSRVRITVWMRVQDRPAQSINKKNRKLF